MNRNAIHQFLRVLGVPRVAHSVEGDEWVNSSCPLASVLHKGGRDDRPSFGILINPNGESLYHCFSGETSVLTFDGAYPISELAGKNSLLLTTGGRWVWSSVISFGKQLLWKLTLCRNGRYKTIFTTIGHRWFLKPKRRAGTLREVTTEQLLPKHRLCSVLPERFVVPEGEASPHWIARGFVFGDGTRQYPSSIAYFHYPKDKVMLPYFAGMGGMRTRQNTSGGTPRLRIAKLPWDFKDLPSLENEKLISLYSWLQGYFAADGCVDKNGCVIFSSAKRENLEFCQDACRRLGIGTYGIGEQRRKGYGKYETSLFHIRLSPTELTGDFFLLPHHRERYIEGGSGRFGWSVVKVEKTDRYEEVFCAEVPETHAFALEGNILTGNCFTCCPTAAPLSGLVHTLWISSFFGWAEAMQAYGKLEIFDEYKKPIDVVVAPPKISCSAVPKWVLNRYPILADASGFEAERCIEYLEGRGISLKTIKKFKLRYGKDQQVIVFPRIDKQDRVWALRARNRKTKGFFSISPKYMLSDTQWGDTSRWFGEQFLTDDPVLLVESETDRLRLSELGVSNVLSSCGQVQKLQLKRLYHIITMLGFDADRAGQQMAYRAAYHLKDVAVLYLLNWNLVGCNDAGELKTYDEYEHVFKNKILLNKGV